MAMFRIPVDVVVAAEIAALPPLGFSEVNHLAIELEPDPDIG
jgi:hypothetical protein